MKRFRFPLQPVKVLRAHHEMRAKENFADAIRELGRAEAALNTVRERVGRFESALRDGRQQMFSPADQAAALVAYRQEREAETAAERAMAAARLKMHERRGEYLDARRQTEVVVRLEQKARAVHQAAGRREEQAALDDFAGRSTTRRASFSV